jgi:hypothetical protein
METIRRFTLRLPEALWTQVKASAEHDQRSMHGQILWLIKRGLESTANADQAEGSPPDPHSSPA